MEIILFENNLYHLIQITKDMLEGIIIPKGSDCFDFCEIIRKNIQFKQEFIGCICR